MLCGYDNDLVQQVTSVIETALTRFGAAPAALLGLLHISVT